MLPKQIIHLFGESACVWTLEKTNFTTFQEEEFIKSPLYCAKEFANLQWVFLLEKVEEHSYLCILRTKKCIDEKPSLKLNFTINIEGEYSSKNNEGQYIKHLKSLVATTTTCKLRRQFFLENARCYDQINITCIVRLTENPVQFFNGEAFFLDEKFSDFVFIVGENRYPAHKIILAANSPVFRAMFSCEMKEKCLNQVEIEDFEPEVIQEFLCFLYKGDISNWEKFGRELFAVAHKYQVKSLQSKCKLFLERNVTFKNVIDLLVFAEHYSIENLKRICIFLINKEFTRIGEQENYLNLRKSHPHLLTDIFNAAIGKLQEPSIQLSASKRVIIKSGAWTMNSCDKTRFSFPTFELKECFWIFVMKRRNKVTIDIFLSKKNKSGLHIANDSLKFKIVVQKAERAAVEIKIEDKKDGYLVMTLDEIGRNFTILWEIESTFELNDTRPSLNYEFFFMNPYLSDIKFNSNGKQFPSHKLLLCNKSAVFRNLFLSERESQNKLLNIQVDEIKPKVLEELLKFIYKGKVENLNDLAHDLYVAAQKYQIHDLKLMCENVLLKNLCSENVISTLIYSDKYNADCLKDECIFLIIKESIRFEENVVDPKVIMEIIDATHTGKRHMVIRNTNTESYLINLILEDILAIFDQELLNESFFLLKCEITIGRITILIITMRLILFNYLSMTKITSIATTVKNKANSIFWKARQLLYCPTTP